MPIEIRELVIKATIDEGGGGKASKPASKSGGGGDEQTIVQKCVDKVLTILKEKAER